MKLVHHTLQIRIARPKRSREPVSAAFGDLLAIGEYVKLTGLAGGYRRLYAKPLLDEGRETRDLRLIAPSCWTGNDLDLHD